MGDINWVGEHYHEEIMQRMDPFARAQMDRSGATLGSTSLHAAAVAGNIPAIELLVSEERGRFYYRRGRNPVDVEKYYVKPGTVAVLTRLKLVTSGRGEEYAFGSPEYEALITRWMEKSSSWRPGAENLADINSLSQRRGDGEETARSRRGVGEERRVRKYLQVPLWRATVHRRQTRPAAVDKVRCLSSEVYEQS